MRRKFMRFLPMVSRRRRLCGGLRGNPDSGEGSGWKNRWKGEIPAASVWRVNVCKGPRGFGTNWSASPTGTDCRTT